MKIPVNGLDGARGPLATALSLELNIYFEIKKVHFSPLNMGPGGKNGL